MGQTDGEYRTTLDLYSRQATVPSLSSVLEGRNFCDTAPPKNPSLHFATRQQQPQDGQSLVAIFIIKNREFHSGNGTNAYLHTLSELWCGCSSQQFLPLLCFQKNGPPQHTLMFLGFITFSCPQMSTDNNQLK